MVVRRQVIAWLLILAQFACYGPTRVYNPRTDFPQRNPGQVKLTFNDGRTTVISSPRVLADTALAGWDVTAEQSVEYPLNSIKTIQGRERSAARTSLLGAVLLGGIIVGSILASAGTSGEDDSSPF